MRYSEYVRNELPLKGLLARAGRGTYLIRETLSYAGAMALVLTVADATPWPLGHERPVARLVFVFMWSVAMAWWQLSRHRHSQDARTASRDVT